MGGHLSGEGRMGPTAVDRKLLRGDLLEWFQVSALLPQWGIAISGRQGAV